MTRQQRHADFPANTQAFPTSHCHTASASLSTSSHAVSFNATACSPPGLEASTARARHTFQLPIPLYRPARPLQLSFSSRHSRPVPTYRIQCVAAVFDTKHHAGCSYILPSRTQSGGTLHSYRTIRTPVCHLNLPR